MCGICGAVSLDGPLDPRIAQSVTRMSAALAHRGPDGDGHHVDTFAALGHRRLAIIDRAAGQQPMSNEDGSCWIVFNGEIYNHHELRKELVAKGHVFRTHCDTEAIVHAYEEFGTSCAQRLEGMFAFAIYDARRRSVFIARDRMGKKPLFYATLGGALHFASEIKALAQSPAWNGEPDLQGLEGYLSLGYFLAPGTAYRHVRSLPPGHWLALTNARTEIQEYWDVEDFDSDTRLESRVLEELDQILRSAVTERLESEVPLGAFLSGGIDSGLVVSYMHEAAADVVTTSVGFAEAEHNELAAAQLTASRFATTHHVELVTPRLEDILDPVVHAFDEPFADSSSIPTYYVSKMARRHVTVALSGDGGDEAFGGYDFRYLPHALEAKARRFVPGSPGRRVSAALGSIWPRSRRLPRIFRLATILENLGRDSAGAYYADLCFLKPGETRRLMGNGSTGRLEDSPVYQAVTEPYRRCRSGSALQRAQYADLKIYLPNDVLVKVDRMSMLHGLEVRCPLLDRRIVEFAFRLPTETKMPSLRSKHLLRQLASRRLPPELATLPKKGFTAPVGSWIAGAYAGAFADDVLSSSSRTRDLLDRETVRRTFEAHRSGSTDHSYALWAVWMLERWLRRPPAAATPGSPTTQDLSATVR
jgi:asparagine synthase (glutamine-hydrolysing)